MGYSISGRGYDVSPFIYIQRLSVFVHPHLVGVHLESWWLENMIRRDLSGNLLAVGKVDWYRQKMQKKGTTLRSSKQHPNSRILWPIPTLG